MLHIPVFISSTFRDFHNERDLLTGPVCDRLNEMLRPFGALVRFIDLRWGVETNELDTQDAARKVLDVCFDEVKRAEPFFLGLVGDRYGWVSEDKMMLHWLSDRIGLDPNLAASASVTELEFAAAGLWSDETENDHNPFILVRNIIGSPPEEYFDADSAPVEEFRRRVVRRWGSSPRLLEYQIHVDQEGVWAISDREKFENLAVSLLGEALRSRAQQVQTGAATEEYIFRDRRQTALGHSETLRTVMMANRCGQPFVVTGSSGAGKSTFMLGLERTAMEMDDTPVTIILGLDERLWSGEELAQAIVDRLGDIFDREVMPAHPRINIADFRRHWRESVAEVLNDQVVFILDGLDKLGSYAGDLWPVQWLAEQGARVCVSTSLSAQVQLLALTRFSTFTIDPLEPHLVHQLIRRWENTNRRKIGERARQVISCSERSPLWVELALSHLLDVGGQDFKAIENDPNQAEAIEGMLEERALSVPDDLEAAVQYLLTETVKHVEPDLSSWVLGLLGSARLGVSQDDVLDVLPERFGSDELSVARLFRTFRDHLVPSGIGEKLRFGHSIYRSVAANLADSTTHLAAAHLYESELLKERAEAGWRSQSFEPLEQIRIERQWQRVRGVAEAFLYHLFHCPPSMQPRNPASIATAIGVFHHPSHESEAATLIQLISLPFGIDHVECADLSASFHQSDGIESVVAALLQAGQLSQDDAMRTRIAKLCKSNAESARDVNRPRLLSRSLNLYGMSVPAKFARQYLSEATETIGHLYQTFYQSDYVSAYYSESLRNLAHAAHLDGDLRAAHNLLKECRGVTRDNIAEFPAQVIVEEAAQVALAHGRVLADAGHRQQALSCLEEASLLVKDLAADGDGPLRSIETMGQIAYEEAMLLRATDLHSALSSFETAERYFTHAALAVPEGEIFQALSASAVVEIARILIHQGQYTQAFERLRLGADLIYPHLSQSPDSTWPSIVKLFKVMTVLEQTAPDSVEPEVGSFFRDQTSKFLNQADNQTVNSHVLEFVEICRDFLLQDLFKGFTRVESVKTLEALYALDDWSAKTLDRPYDRFLGGQYLMTLAHLHASQGRIENAKACLAQLRGDCDLIGRGTEFEATLYEYAVLRYRIASALAFKHWAPEISIDLHRAVIDEFDAIVSPSETDTVLALAYEVLSKSVAESAEALLHTEAGSAAEREWWRQVFNKSKDA